MSFYQEVSMLSWDGRHDGSVQILRGLERDIRFVYAVYDVAMINLMVRHLLQQPMLQLHHRFILCGATSHRYGWA